MVLSDGTVHFLKIEKNTPNLPKLYCDFKGSMTHFASTPDLHESSSAGGF